MGLRRLGFAAASLLLAVSGVLASVGTSSAATHYCTNLAIDGFCTGVQTAQTPVVALTVAVTSPRSNSNLVMTAPVRLKDQDFDVRQALAGGGVIIQWAPRGFLSGKCVTEVGSVRTPVILERCTGASNQIWSQRFTAILPGQPIQFNLINVASHLAMTNASGEVQVRSLGSGTGLNKIWEFPNLP